MKLKLYPVRALGTIVAQITAAALLAMGGCTAAQAQGPGECQMTVNDSSVDYGVFTRYQLQGENPQAPTLSLGKRQLTLNMNCRMPVTMAVAFRSGANGADYSFGNGGTVTVRMTGAQVDGRPALVGSSAGAGMIPASPAAIAQFAPGQVIVPIVDGRPAKGTSFSAQVEVDPRIPAANARVAGRTSLESNGSFQLITQ
ncbi:DUF1120 domain-containing protein [Paraburkholderia saeva]|uniref:DUF1120 domain-containing protein n=1 Tax=Paraburkholderia saeva TaxID=2777537 RepID=A0A9N8X360_9BURK|nr:hypothetical protein [Paraburkholderia saeva]CAG4909545.1 hypothetical protein LMG31841_03878 [Paraburkholderia saeva]